MMDDPYLDMIDEQWDHILMLYEQYRDKKPIIEYDIQNMKIYSYSATEYIDKLSTRTRIHMENQYKEATIQNKFILFVKDTENQKLRSYVFNAPE